VKRTLAGVSVGWLGLSMIGDGVPGLLLPHQLLSDGRTDATTLGLITLVAIGLAALLQPVAGRLSDEYGRVPVIVAGVVVAVLGLVTLLLPGGAVPGAVVALLGASIAQAGQQPLLPDLVGSDARGRGAGLKGAFDVGGAFLGFLLLAALLGTGSTALAVALLAGVLVAAFVLAFVLLRRTLPAVEARAAGRRHHLDFSVSAPFLRIVLARFAFLLGIYVVGRFLVLFVAQRLGLDANAAAEQGGLVLAALTLATVVASLPAGWLADRLGRGPLMLSGGILAALGMALIPLAGGMLPLIGLGILLALGSAAFSAGSWATLTDLADGTDAGRLLGIASWGTAGAAAAAGLAGPLIDAGEAAGAGFGFVAAFALAALLAAVGGALGWRLTRQRSTSTIEITQSEGVA
jgi:MFS family permease